MTRIQDDLYALWDLAHRAPRWLPMLAETMTLDAEDEAHLTDLDDAWRAGARVLEDRWRKEAQPTPEPPDGMGWANERRIEYLQGQIAAISEQMRGDSAEYYRMVNEDRPLFDRLLLRGCSPISLTKDPRAKLIWEIRSLQTPEVRGELTDTMIEKARAFPLERLVEPKNEYILCPFHSDRKPSMWVRNGFGFCFPCQKTLDAIGYMMHVKALSFPDAVKALQ